MNLSFKARTVVTGILGFAALGFYFAAEAGMSRHELERLREQNRVLATQIKDLQGNFETIKTYTGSVRALANAEIPPARIDHQKDELRLYVNTAELGLFGRLALAAKAAPEVHEAFERKSDLEAFTDMVVTLEAMSRDTGSVVRRLRSLATILRHNETLVRAIPSIRPAVGRITSEYGMRLSPFDGAKQMHTGIDIAAAPGAPIKSPADGVVTFVGDFETLGNTIVVNHGSGILTRYGHTQRSFVKVGDKVKRGQTIGAVGNTGRSTGPHLHYEIWVKNQPVNPRDFFFDLGDQPGSLVKERGKGRRMPLVGMGGGDLVH